MSAQLTAQQSRPNPAVSQVCKHKFRDGVQETLYISGERI